MQLFYCPEVINGTLYLNPDESRHCFKVLRKKLGDVIHLIDGEGNFYEVRINMASQKRISFEIIKSWPEEKRPYDLHIAIAPPKNIDRFEWFLEKVTEIGIDEITPVFCDHSERKTIKKERLFKILLSATKQSLKAKLPVLNAPISFRNFILKNHSTSCYIAHCQNQNKESLKNLPSSNTTILIGPEGDFSSNEISLALKNAFTPIHLGNSRLRTETAGVVACHTVALQNEKI
jgi:16S rRNA (uracil1498-N3)-methyltransferase